MPDDPKVFRDKLATALKTEAAWYLRSKLHCDFGVEPERWWECKARAQLFSEAANVAHVLAVQGGRTDAHIRNAVVAKFLERDPGAQENWSEEVQREAVGSVLRFIREFGVLD